MKHAVKKHNKLLALFLVLALLISAVPMGIAFAEDAVYPVVVDGSYTGDSVHWLTMMQQVIPPLISQPTQLLPRL